MPSTCLEAGSERATAMPSRRLLRAYLIEAKYESLRMLRTPGFAIPFLGLPVMLFLLIGVVLFGNAVGVDPNKARFMFAAFAVLGMMGPGMFGFGMVLAMEREQGLLTLKRALPVPMASCLLAKTLMSMLFGAIIMATLITAATSVGHLRLTLGQTFSVTGLCILGTLPFSAVGLLIGTLATGRSATAFVNVVYQVMLHLSGLFYPLPHFMQTIATVWPTHHLQQMVLSSLGAPSHGQPIIHLAVLAVLTVLFALLAVRRLSRLG